MSYKLVCHFDVPEVFGSLTTTYRVLRSESDDGVQHSLEMNRPDALGAPSWQRVEDGEYIGRLCEAAHRAGHEAGVAFGIEKNYPDTRDTREHREEAQGRTR